MFNAHDHWCPAEEREQKKIRASQAPIRATRASASCVRSVRRVLHTLDNNADHRPDRLVLGHHVGLRGAGHHPGWIESIDRLSIDQVIFILSMIELQQNVYNGHAFTYGAEVGGYLLGFLPVAMIPAFAIVKLVKYARGYVSTRIP